MGEAWEATLEGGGGANNLRKVLPRGSAGGNIVWIRDMGDHGDNDSAIYRERM